MGKEAEEKLDEVYSRIPSINCKGLCHTSCGPIPMSEEEWRRITNRMGRCPQFDSHLNCSLLTPEGRCSVYDIRPAICRIWGVSEELQCPYGCEPERLLTEGEVFAIIKEVHEIGGPTMISRRKEF